MEDIKTLLKENNQELRKDIKHDIKEAVDESEEKFERYASVLSEDFKSQVSLIGEQQGSIMKKLDSHTEMIGAMKEDVEVINLNLNSNTEKLDSHTEMIGGLKEDIEVIKMNVEFIKGSLKKKVDIEEFESLESRVSLLEAKSHA